ncbi:hypothetical protein BgiMline_023251 [Biomphalaria glabrata]
MKKTMATKIKMNGQMAKDQQDLESRLLEFNGYFYMEGRDFCPIRDISTWKARGPP